MCFGVVDSSGYDEGWDSAEWEMLQYAGRAGVFEQEQGCRCDGD